MLTKEITLREFSVKLGDLLAESHKRGAPKTKGSPDKLPSEVIKREHKPTYQAPHRIEDKKVPMTQHKGSLNIQDQFLNHVRREKMIVSVRFLDGTAIQGHIKSFDNFCIQLESTPHGETLIYKHGISSITHSTLSDLAEKA